MIKSYPIKLSSTKKVGRDCKKKMISVETMQRVAYSPAISVGPTCELWPSNICWHFERTMMGWARPRKSQIPGGKSHIFFICLVLHGAVNIHPSVDLY